MAITTGGETKRGNTVINPDTGAGYTGKELHMSTLPAAAPKPTSAPPPSWRPPTRSTAVSGPSAADIAAQQAAAAEAAAKAAARAQSSKENANTNAVVDALVASLSNYARGRDTMLDNVEKTFDTALSGILSQYLQSKKDTGEFSERNESDFDAKTNANVVNRVRETNDALAQVLTLGAGETDALRAMSQAIRAADASQLDMSASYADTLRSINSQLRSAGSSAENARLNTWNQSQESRAQVWNDFNKNMADTWTNIQRTEAANTNVESAYSEGFNNRYGSDDAINAVTEIGKYAGAAYEMEKPKDDWAAKFEGRRGDYENASNRGNKAAAVSLGPLQRAEGATLRRF